MKTECNLQCGSLSIRIMCLEVDERSDGHHSVNLPGLRLGSAWSEVRKCMNGGTVRIWYAQKILSLKPVVVVDDSLLLWR